MVDPNPCPGSLRPSGEAALAKARPGLARSPLSASSLKINPYPCAPLLISRHCHAPETYFEFCLRLTLSQVSQVPLCSAPY
jgi:hypothetical protein